MSRMVSCAHALHEASSHSASSHRTSPSVAGGPIGWLRCMFQFEISDAFPKIQRHRPNERTTPTSLLPRTHRPPSEAAGGRATLGIE